MPKEKFILFLCGGRWQIPWLSFLKNKGHKIILVDPNPNPPCLKLADIFIQTNVKEICNIENRVRQLGVEVQLVTSDQTDVSVIPVAVLSVAFGTKGNRPEVVELYANKLKSRIFIKERFGDHIPMFNLVSSGSDVANLTREMNCEIIVKPVDAQSSRGIFLARPNMQLEQLNEQFDACAKHSVSRQVIAEECLYGTEITVEGICLGGRHVITAMSRKQHFRIGIASDLKYPLLIETNLQKRLVNFHTELIESTGFEFGITHSEYIVSEKDGKFWLVEMACRGGGTLIPSHITPIVSGLDIYQMIYDYVFSGVSCLPQLRYIEPVAACLLHFFEFRPGKVKTIEGVDTCRSIPAVIDIALEFEGGDLISPANDDRSRQGYVIIKGVDIGFIENQVELINDTIKVGYE